MSGAGSGHGTGKAVILTLLRQKVFLRSKGLFPRHLKRQIFASVKLRHATPKAVYDVRLIQILPGGRDCAMVDGKLFTNFGGNGHANVREAIMPGATRVFVVLNNHAMFGSDFYTTHPVPIFRSNHFEHGR